MATSLDALVFVTDPIGSALQYAVSWLIEQVNPLRQALDLLAGNPARIQAHALTWQNVAGALKQEAVDLDAAVRRDVAEWEGRATSTAPRDGSTTGGVDSSGAPSRPGSCRAGLPR